VKGKARAYDRKLTLHLTWSLSHTAFESASEDGWRRRERNATAIKEDHEMDPVKVEEILKRTMITKERPLLTYK
jgi:hypothetical protein